MLKNKVIVSIFVILFYLILLVTVNKINSFSYNINYDHIISSSFPNKINMEKIDSKTNIIKDKDLIGNIYIPKINLNKPLYSPNSTKNNIEENVTILDGSVFPSEESSIIFLAAHSGSGTKAYFNNLKYLDVDDEIYLNYYNKSYSYIVSEVKEVEKNGYITGKRKTNHEIILTTCSDTKGKQLIIYGIRKSN